jgi:acyl-CoA synthetase (AMP-forming)/AMP-acid ligase II/acyl carrier protein
MRCTIQELYSRNPDFHFLSILHGDSEQFFSLKQLVERMNDYCLLYQENGVERGTTVLIILKESLDLFASFLAGVVWGALPAYFAYPSQKQTKESFINSLYTLLAFNDIKVLITYDEVLDIVEGQKDLATRIALRVAHDHVKHSKKLNLDEYTVPVSEAFLQFSSGTTGAKKGVKIPVSALFNQINAYKGCLDFSNDSKVISWLPHYHDMGLIACMLMPLLTGVPIYMMSPFEWVTRPRLLFDAITKYRCTHVWLPNFALGHLVHSMQGDDLSGLDISSVRQLVCCSEPVLYETVKKFIERFTVAGFNESAMRNCYAMAENTYAMTSSLKGPINFIQIDAQLLQKSGTITPSLNGIFISSVGVPLPNTSLRIIDRGGEECKERKVGEIIIKSDCMLECYHNNPEETKASFINGWFKTGDLGFVLNGELYVIGRRKDMIIIAGENIYPQDIEEVLNDNPGVVPGRNVVFGLEDKVLGTERIVVLVEYKNRPEEIVVLKMRAKIFSKFGLSVSEIVPLPHMTLKKGTAGKISRFLNKQEYLSGAYAQYIRSGTIPHLDGDEENKIVELLFGIIDPEELTGISIDTPLITSGLIDSLNFVSLILKLEKHYNIEIPRGIVNRENFQSIADIKRTMRTLKARTTVRSDIKRGFLERLREFYKS